MDGARARAHQGSLWRVEFADCGSVGHGSDTSRESLEPSDDGPASGFLASGVAYALSNIIADSVAGVYLLRDPDFNPGDEVTVGDLTETVRSIEPRKTRFSVEGDTVVRGNADIEKRWRKTEARADPRGSRQVVVRAPPTLIAPGVQRRV